MLSGPAALSGFKFLSNLEIPSVEMVMSDIVGNLSSYWSVVVLILPSEM